MKGHTKMSSWKPTFSDLPAKEKCPKCKLLTVSEHQVIAEQSLRDILKGGKDVLLKPQNLRTQNNLTVPEAFGATLLGYLASVGTMHILARLTHVKYCSNCHYT